MAKGQDKGGKDKLQNKKIGIKEKRKIKNDKKKEKGLGIKISQD